MSLESCDRFARCLCGAARITMRGPLPDVAAVPVPQDRIVVEVEDHVRWYPSSAKAGRGFCETCGSSILWRAFGRGDIDVALGCLGSPTGLRLAGHIRVGDKGDYHEIADGLPQERAQ